MRNPTRPANSPKLLRAPLAVSITILSALFAAGQNVGTSESGVISIPLLAAAEMPAADARLAADSQSAIARSAAIYGYILDSGYDYKEIGCPYAPNYLLLSYESLQPGGTASRFTAIVPRNTGSAEAAQIISISHFGSVPYLPAASNPHTFAVFNRVVTAAPVGLAVADNPQSNPLLANSLCYLAMIGEPPAALRAPSLDPATVRGPVPTLQFRENGTVSQVITVRDSSDTYQVWTFTFARNGSLLTAARVDHPIDTTPPMVNAINSAAPGENSQPVTAAVAAPKTTAAPEPAVAATPAAPAVPSSPAAAAPLAPSVSAAAAPPNPPPAPGAAPPAPGAPPAAAANGMASEKGPVVENSAVAPAPPAPATAVVTTPNAAVDAAAPNTAPIENSATPAAPAPTSAAPRASSSVVRAPTAHVPSRPAVSHPVVATAAKGRVPATVTPLPPQRLIRNLPAPPSRIIPDGSLPYPPQAPAK
jgi:hypothetical protein